MTTGWRELIEKELQFRFFTTIRPYLFVGAILAVLAFLLYNEAIIKEFEEEKRNQVGLFAELYAFAASQSATDEQTSLIFTEVIDKTDFPIIFTDFRGSIADWKGDGLPAVGDTSRASMMLLQQLLEKMDEKNEPKPFEAFPETRGLLHYKQGSFVLTNRAGIIAGWRGDHLPPDTDTTSATVSILRAAIARMDETNEPLSFDITSGKFSYLHNQGRDFVITDGDGNIIEWWGANLPERGNRAPAVESQIRAFMTRISAGIEPYAFKIPSETIKYLHYGDSQLVSRISWANFVFAGILILFSIVGYVGFRNIRKSEQRSIWVGMAKETAHQLGTPLSSLSGWLELIKNDLESPPREQAGGMNSVAQKVSEMQRDLQRLNQIASRFSQVGSVPELKMGDIANVLQETIRYFNSRGPQFGQVKLELRRKPVPLVPLNTELMSWAFENLCRNGIDAIGQRGGQLVISLSMHPGSDRIQITFQDNGRGIEPENVDRIFDPGFSTKKRGWGLGLAFVKRIVEEYHNGKISITQSVPGEGTTFEVLLPCERKLS